MHACIFFYRNLQNWGRIEQAGDSIMSLHHVTEVAWSNLLTAWDYPFPVGMMFLSSALLVFAGLSISVRAFRESRQQRTPE